MLSYSARSNDMLTSKELQVGKRYKMRSELYHTRKDSFGPCQTLTGKRHLANGTRYELTFDNGRNRQWQFYNITDEPIFKPCSTRCTNN